MWNSIRKRKSWLLSFAWIKILRSVLLLFLSFSIFPRPYGIFHVDCGIFIVMVKEKNPKKKRLDYYYLVLYKMIWSAQSFNLIFSSYFVTIFVFYFGMLYHSQTHIHRAQFECKYWRGYARVYMTTSCLYIYICGRI